MHHPSSLSRYLVSKESYQQSTGVEIAERILRVQFTLTVRILLESKDVHVGDKERGWNSTLFHHLLGLRKDRPQATMA